MKKLHNYLVTILHLINDDRWFEIAKKIDIENIYFLNNNIYYLDNIISTKYNNNVNNLDI